MLIKIDEETKRVEFFTQNIWGGVYCPGHATMNVWGEDLTGRKCVVAEHTIDNLTLFIDHIEKGGVIRARGHKYSKAHEGANK